MVSDEAEALQTDIMRFLSIICMCLMIVFSLVQSMPVSEAENKPRIKSREMLEREIRTLEERAGLLKKTILSLNNEIAMKKEQLDQSLEKVKAQQKRAGELDTTIQQKLKEIRRREKVLSDIALSTESAKEKEKNIRDMARKVRQALLQQRVDLGRTARRIAEGRKQLKGVESDLSRARAEVRKLERKKAEPGSIEAFGPEPEKKSTATPTAQEEKEGFSLGFASNGVLLQLLKKENTVKLYMLSGTRSWQLKVEPSGNVAFFSSPFPKKIYEMDRRTVPQKIIHAGRRAVAAFGKGGVTYGVALSPGITRQIGRLMNGRKGGNLVISSQNKVILE